MYRVLDDITVVTTGQRIAKGTLSRLEEMTDKSRKALLASGVIARIESPPLAVLPGWESRAARLAAMGIETVEQLLEGASNDIAQGVGSTARTIERWKADAQAYLIT